MKRCNPILFIICITLMRQLSFAQQSDSLTILYKSQKTIIPVPERGSQTTIGFSDSSKMVEVGVWTRKAGETVSLPQLSKIYNGEETVKNKSKWFSMIEAGYMLEFTHVSGSKITKNYLLNSSSWYNLLEKSYNMSDRRGFQFKLSVMENEFVLSDNHSIYTGFKFGYSKSYLHAKIYSSVLDSTYKLIDFSYSDEQVKISSFQYLFQIGFLYKYHIGKVPAKLNIGNSLGFIKLNINSRIYYSYSYSSRYIYTSLLQPYIGFEFGKTGILFSADLNVRNRNKYMMEEIPFRSIYGITLTYRFF